MSENFIQEAETWAETEAGKAVAAIKAAIPAEQLTDDVNGAIKTVEGLLQTGGDAAVAAVNPVPALTPEEQDLLNGLLTKAEATVEADADAVIAAANETKAARMAIATSLKGELGL